MALSPSRCEVKNISLLEVVSFAQGASLPIAGLTALHGLREGGPVLGRRVLVAGAMGGVGQFAVEALRTGQVNGKAVLTRD